MLRAKQGNYYRRLLGSFLLEYHHHCQEYKMSSENGGRRSRRTRKTINNMAASLMKSITAGTRRPQDTSHTSSLVSLGKESVRGSIRDEDGPGHEKRISFDFDNQDSDQSLVDRGSSGRRGRGSMRRDNVDQRELLMGLSDLSADFLDLVLKSKGCDWLKSLSLRDPRFCIKTFFDDVAKDGANSIEEGIFQPELLSPLIAMFQRSSVFSVWRPTSIDSIEKMMKGHGVGKGLDIKGKSAKKGKLSAYVPFLQIHEDEHKTKIRPLPSGGRIRVFYRKESPRDKAYNFLVEVMSDMMDKVKTAKVQLNEQPNQGDPKGKDDFVLSDFRSKSRKVILDDDDKARNLINSWEMDSPSITKIDDYTPKCYGIEMPKRLFWEGYVMRANDISRPAGSDFETGRPSTPGFQVSLIFLL